jgi:hypothetical protein
LTQEILNYPHLTMYSIRLMAQSIFQNNTFLHFQFLSQFQLYIHFVPIIYKDHYTCFAQFLDPCRTYYYYFNYITLD